MGLKGFVDDVDDDETNQKRIAQIIKLSMKRSYFGLEFLPSMGVKHVEAFGDSLLVVQQVFKVC